MNRDFLSNFEKRETPVESPNIDQSEPAEHSDEFYKVGELCRCLFFVWPDGKQYFIDYSRLDSGSIDPSHNHIQLTFGREIVELMGERLRTLYLSIASHSRKTVYCEDARYNDLVVDVSVVNKITITLVT